MDAKSEPTFSKEDTLIESNPTMLPVYAIKILKPFNLYQHLMEANFKHFKQKFISRVL